MKELSSFSPKKANNSIEKTGDINDHSKQSYQKMMTNQPNELNYNTSKGFERPNDIPRKTKREGRSPVGKD